MLDPRDSTTYQAILREGRIVGGQRVLILQGTHKFGKPDGATLAAIEAIRDLERLEAVAYRMLDQSVHDWGELLQTA